MKSQPEELAQRFEKVNGEFVALAERPDTAQWGRRTPMEDWSVAATARHIAEDHVLLARFAETSPPEGHCPISPSTPSTR